MSRCLWGALLAVGMLAANVEAGPITAQYTRNDELGFGLRIVGSDFDSDMKHVILSPNLPWTVTGTITEGAGLINDVLSINLVATHIFAPQDPPHGEPANINNFPINITVDADNYKPGTHELAFADNIPHEQHWNYFTYRLRFTTETTLNFDDITGYTLEVSGRHSTTPLPEPATLSLLGVGTLALVRYGRRRPRHDG